MLLPSRIRSTGRNIVAATGCDARGSLPYRVASRRVAPRRAAPLRSAPDPSSKSPPLTSAERARLTSVRARPESSCVARNDGTRQRAGGERARAQTRPGRRGKAAKARQSGAVRRTPDRTDRPAAVARVYALQLIRVRVSSTNLPREED